MSIRLRVAYETYHRSHEHSSTTIKDYHTALNHWERLTDDPPIDQVTNLTCRQFKEAMLSTPPPGQPPLRPATILKYMRELQAIFATLGPCGPQNKQGLGLLPSVPCFPSLRLDDPNVITAEDAEIAAILQHCAVATWPNRVIEMHSRRVVLVHPPEWWLNLILYLGTFGSRRNEFLRLRCEDVDIERARLTLDPAKHGERNWKPIPRELLPYFAAFLSEPRELFFAAPRCVKLLYRQWHQIQQAAGIHVRRAAGSTRRPYYGFHELRKTCGTAWAAVSPAAGKHMLGHKSQQVFDRCYTNSNAVAQRSIAAFPSPTALLTGTEPAAPFRSTVSTLTIFSG